MNYFKNNKIITLIVVLILVINITALATLLVMRFGEPKGPNRGPKGEDKQRTAHILKEELQFSDEQLDIFIQLEEAFLKKDEELRHKEAELKSQLIGSLLEEGVEVNADSNISLIAANVSEREKITFAFFTNLKELCTEEQKDSFHKLMGMFLRRLDPNHRPPKDGPEGQNPPGVHSERGHMPPHPQGKPGERPLPPPRKTK